jgi:hypothetical protein
MRILRYAFAMVIFVGGLYFVSFRLIVIRQRNLAEKDGYVGYYFIHPPVNSEQWQIDERRWRTFYLPLTALDSWRNSKTVPASFPCYEIE